MKKLALSADIVDTEDIALKMNSLDAWLQDLHAELLQLSAQTKTRFESLSGNIRDILVGIGAIDFNLNNTMLSVSTLSAEFSNVKTAVFEQIDQAVSEINGVSRQLAAVESRV